MKKWWLYSFFFLSTSSNVVNASLEQYSANKAKLVLDTEHCLLKANDTILPLGMTANCFFIRDKISGKIDSYTYKADASRVLLVVGTPLEEASTSFSRQKQGCGSQVRAVIMVGDQVKLSSTVLSNSQVCAREGVDQSIFDQLVD